MTQLAATTIVRVRALNLLPDFIDLTGRITGTPNAVYNPAVCNETGFMMWAQAQIDEGTNVSTCFTNTPGDIETALRTAGCPIDGPAEVLIDTVAPAKRPTRKSARSRKASAKVAAEVEIAVEDLRVESDTQD